MVSGTKSHSGPIFGSINGPTAGPAVRDPYRQMEVRIQKGQLKGYFATVVGTHWQADGSLIVDLKVCSQLTGYKVSLPIGDVVGRL